MTPYEQNLLHHGTGVDKDLPKAVELYTQAVAKGDAQAMCNLGDCYKDGKCGLIVNLSEARRFYQMAADKDHTAAAAALAQLSRGSRRFLSRRQQETEWLMPWE